MNNSKIKPGDQVTWSDGLKRGIVRTMSQNCSIVIVEIPNGRPRFIPLDVKRDRVTVAPTLFEAEPQGIAS